MVEASRRITAASHCADDAAMVRKLRRRWALACCARRTLAFLHPSADAARHARPDHAICGQHGARPALPRLLRPAQRVVHVRRGSRPACSRCSESAAHGCTRCIAVEELSCVLRVVAKEPQCTQAHDSDCDRHEWPQACSEYRPPHGGFSVLQRSTGEIDPYAL